MRYVECPETYEPHPTDGPLVFFAGGITGCPDWQATAAEALAETDWVVANPRRAHFPIDDPTASEHQVAWEYRHLQLAELVLFWFPACDPAVTTQPIALFELGTTAAAGKNLVVGADPDYPRAADVHLQLGHHRPEVTVHTRLADVLAHVTEDLR